MIVWLNGPFGVGKTTTARALLEVEPGWALFDSERVGFMLRHALTKRRPVSYFQDWASWRRVVVASLAAVHDELASTIVVPQTVVIESYWREVVAGLRAYGLPLNAFTRCHQRGHAADHDEIARDTVTFVRALNFDQVDLFGFSVGAMIAQVNGGDSIPAPLATFTIRPLAASRHSSKDSAGAEDRTEEIDLQEPPPDDTAARS